MRSVKEAYLKDRIVLVRVDFNVPLNPDGSMEDDERIRAALPTINYILDGGAKQIILMTHLGRPDGKVVDGLRLGVVSRRLSSLLGTDVVQLNDCIDVRIPESAKIVMLENLRFHPEEEKDDALFARKLAVDADVYVNEAFSVSHRAHASVHAVTKLLPSYAGLELMEEVKNLDITNAKHPIVAVMGGAKVSDKIGLIENMLKKVDAILIGGAMTFTFLKSLGFNIGRSKVELDKLELAKNLLERANKKLVLPIDILVADKIDKSANTRDSDIDRMRDNDIGVDVGEETISVYKEILSGAKTVVWNGPLGIFEIDKFSNGTREIALQLAQLTKKGVKTIIGGGDTTALLDKMNLADKMTHVSTGGGASLEFLEGKELPGLKALDENTKV